MINHTARFPIKPTGIGSNIKNESFEIRVLFELFYNLFCCGPGLFTDSDYLAGWYIFDQQPDATNFGLTAVASATPPAISQRCVRGRSR